MAKENILVVDDEPNIREVVELYLRREGYEVEVTADGETALRATMLLMALADLPLRWPSTMTKESPP